MVRMKVSEIIDSDDEEKLRVDQKINNHIQARLNVMRLSTIVLVARMILFVSYHLVGFAGREVSNFLNFAEPSEISIF